MPSYLMPLDAYTVPRWMLWWFSMTAPPALDGYDRYGRRPTDHENCALSYGFNTSLNEITSFQVKLFHSPTRTIRNWSEIARIDHNPGGINGHDLYSEGIHVDVVRAAGGESIVYPNHESLPPDTGEVLRICIAYFETNADFFLDLFRGSTDPPASVDSVPPWSDPDD